MKKENKKIIVSLVGISVIIGLIIGGFAFNELLNVDAKDRLVSKISSYKIEEMNERKDSVVEEWKRQGIFRISKKGLINELREIENSAKEIKNELEKAGKFLDDNKIEGAKYSKMPSYTKYEKILNRFETSISENDFKIIQSLKEEIEQSINILKEEELKENQRIEEEENKRKQELAEAEEEAKRLKKEKEEERKREEMEIGEYCSQLTKDALVAYADAVTTGETWKIDQYYKYGSKEHKGVVSLIETFYSKGYHLILEYCNILDYKYDGEICKVHTDESYYNYTTQKTIYQEMIYYWKYMDGDWRMKGAKTYDRNSY